MHVNAVKAPENAEKKNKQKIRKKEKDRRKIICGLLLILLNIYLDTVYLDRAVGANEYILLSVDHPCFYKVRCLA